MKLLVSVADATEATAALEGGADIIDAKNPRAGALGPVTLDDLRAIHANCAGVRPVTAALGDASDEDKVEKDAMAYCGAGAALIKIGFAYRRGLDVAAGCLIGGVAVLALLRFRWRGPGRLALISALVAAGGALLVVQELL